MSIGLDLLGAKHQHCPPLTHCTDFTLVGAASLISSRADIFTSPVYAIANPPAGSISTRWDNVIGRVVVSGGRRMKAYFGDAKLTAYEKPSTVAITFSNGKPPLTLRNLAFFQIKCEPSRTKYDTSADKPSTIWTTIKRAITVGDMPLVGLFDLAEKTRQIDTIKQPTVAIARVMLKQAQATINQAREAGASLPGTTARDNCYWKLDYYTKQLANRSDPTAVFGAEWGDLRKWVLQAFIESNAVEEGNTHAAANWNAMWDDIAAELLRLPQRARDAVTGVIGWIIPWYMWAGGATVVAMLGYAAYRIMHAAAPEVGRVAAQRYLP